MLPRTARKNLRIVIGLTVAFSIAATRTEKLFAEMQASVPRQTTVMFSAVDHALPQPFDPERVPQSGGMASRLLAGIGVNVAML